MLGGINVDKISNTEKPSTDPGSVCMAKTPIFPGRNKQNINIPINVAAIEVNR